MRAATPDASTPPSKRRVLIVDDHAVVREGLARRINGEPDLVVCGEAQSAAEGLEAIHRLQPDIVILDLALASGHGLELVKDLRAQNHPVPILVFTMYEESIYALRALQAGAQGYLTKAESPERFLIALRSILKGDYAFSPQASTRFLRTLLQPSAKSAASQAKSAGRSDLSETLGDRELEVFGLIGKGKSTREIASELGRSVKTIETYRARIKQKLQLTSGTALIREAVRWVETRR